MNSLKKTLALALVFVMAFGLMISSSAADFSDAKDVQYTEAVEVMTGIGAINGLPDGSFNPDGKVTRAQAAKMIAYATLGPKVAENLKATGGIFTDVPASFWGASFIEFCYSRNIVNGKGAGKFVPNGDVTTYELAKMILTATGYGKNNEYVGSSWLVNVAIDATDLGIFDGLKDANYADAATREEAALMIFNGVSKIAQVNFDKTIDDYVASGVGTIGVQKYGLNKASTTVNGVSGYTWKNAAGAALSSFIVTENVVGTSTDGTTIANLGTKTHAKFIAELDSVVTYVRNGTVIPEYVNNAVYAKDALVSYNGTLYKVTDNGGLLATDTNAALASKAAVYTIGKGVIVKFINSDADAKVEKIAITEKTVAFVGAAPSVNPTTGAVTINPIGTFAKDTVVYPADLAPFTYVLLYTDGLGVTHIEKAAVVKGQMTSANTTAKTIVINGVVYAESGLVTANSVVPAFYGTSTNFNKDATAYIDDNKDIIAIATDVVSGPATKYGLVVGYEYTAAGTGLLGTPASAKVLLYTEDGAVKIYDVAAAANGIVPDQSTTFDFTSEKAYLVSYSFNDAEKVTLTVAGTPDTLSANYAAKGATLGLTTAAKNVYITSDTKVVYFNDAVAYNALTNTAKFVVGYSNTSAATAGDNVTYVLKTGTNNVEVIFVGNAPATVTVPGNYAYVQTVGVNVRYVNGNALYDYNVFVNGVATTLTATANTYFGATGLYSYTLDSNGMVVATPSLATAVTGGNVTYVDAGFVAYVDNNVNKSVPVTSSTAYYQVSATGVAAAPIAASSTYTTYSISYIQLDNQGNAAAIYFVVS